MTDYKPVSCVNYERFEVAIVHHEQLRLSWHEANVVYDQVVTPTGLETRAGEEFLLFRDAAGHSTQVRLDRIRKVTSA